MIPDITRLAHYLQQNRNDYLPECARPAIYMWGADLRGTKISDTTLYAPNLTEANLSGANLGRDRFIPYGANLRNANLKGAKGWTNEQLAQAISLIGATLPDGTVIKTEEESEEFKKRYRQ
jgi:uncharacterized protein YjbI with pentapeptide repeats